MIWVKVSHKGNKIGEMPLTIQVREDENIYLSARIWKIAHVDLKSKKIEVIPANDGKKPIFEGNGATIAERIRQKMLEILVSKKEYDFLDEPSQNIITEMQKEFSIFDINDLYSQRPLHSTNSNLTFFSFTSSKINKTLKIVFDAVGIENFYTELESAFEIKINKDEFAQKLKNLSSFDVNIDLVLANVLDATPNILDFSKYGKFLPVKFQLEILKNSYYDLLGCERFLRSLKIVNN